MNQPPHEATVDGQTFTPESVIMGKLWDGDPRYRLEPGPIESVLSSGLCDLVERIMESQGVFEEFDRSRANLTFSNEVFTLRPFSYDEGEPNFE